MIVLGYIGDHKKDTLSVRLGWALVRLAQWRSGTYHKVTHTELVLDGTTCRGATIASASIRDGGVRTKTVDLERGNWIALEVPAWEPARPAARKWFKEHDGQGYDTIGALATRIWWLRQSIEKWFCNESDGAAVGLLDPAQYLPAQFFAIAASLPGSRDVTDEFFA